MLNNIERNVESAVEYAQKAHTNMIKAKNMRANVRKVVRITITIFQILDPENFHQENSAFIPLFAYSDFKIDVADFISEKNMFADRDHRLHNFYIFCGDDAVLLLCTISMPLKKNDLYVISLFVLKFSLLTIQITVVLLSFFFLKLDLCFLCFLIPFMFSS